MAGYCFDKKYIIAGKYHTLAGVLFPACKIISVLISNQLSVILSWGCMDSTGVLKRGLPAEVPSTFLKQAAKHNR